jgi:hypothetical protein
MARPNGSLKTWQTNTPPRGSLSVKDTSWKDSLHDRGADDEEPRLVDTLVPFWKMKTHAQIKSFIPAKLPSVPAASHLVRGPIMLHSAQSVRRCLHLNPGNISGWYSASQPHCLACCWPKGCKQNTLGSGHKFRNMQGLPLEFQSTKHQQHTTRERRLS